MQFQLNLTDYISLNLTNFHLKTDNLMIAIVPNKDQDFYFTFYPCKCKISHTRINDISLIFREKSV